MDLGLAKKLHCRIQYLKVGAVIGSKEFVNEVFAGARKRFGMERRDGATKKRGDASAAEGKLLSLRDLRMGI
jgi:putative transposase